MNSGPLLFLGLFLTMSCSWLGFVLGPVLQIGDMRTTAEKMPGALDKPYPNPQAGAAHQGAEIYRANGCASCHTQLVRPRELGPDINRGWGVRRSTGYDYLYDNPVMLGTQRIGPDLANAGRRMDMTAVLLHIYAPRSIPGNSHSIMPPFPYLFEKRKIAGAPAADALRLTAPYAPPDGEEIVPTPAARKLAAYIVSLHQDGYLFEAPPPPELTAKTKAPAKAMTNSPVK